MEGCCWWWREGGFYFAGLLIRRAFVSIFFSTENKKSLFLLNASVGNVDANVVHTSTGGGGRTTQPSAGHRQRREGNGTWEREEGRECGGGGRCCLFWCPFLQWRRHQKIFFPSSFETEQRVGLEAAIKRERAPVVPPSLKKKKKKKAQPGNHVEISIPRSKSIVWVPALQYPWSPLL